MRHSVIRMQIGARRAPRAAAALAVAALAVAALAVAVPAAAGAQPESPMAACAQGGMLLRQPRFGALPGADSAATANARRLLEAQQVMSMAAARAGGEQPGAPKIRISFARGWLGLRTLGVSETRLGPDGRYVRYCDYPVVVSVEAASPAEKAGLEPGDTIVAYNDIDLRKGTEIALDRLLVPEATVRVSVRRDGRTLMLPLVVGRHPSESSVAQVFASSGGNGYGYVVLNPDQGAMVTVPRATEAPAGGTRLRATMRRPREVTEPSLPALAPTPLMFGIGLSGTAAIAGAQLMAMDDDLRAVVGARKGGVLVLKVADGTPASEAGLRSGDVIVTADGVAVTSPMVVTRAFLRSQDDHAVPLKVERRGKTREVILRW